MGGWVYIEEMLQRVPWTKVFVTGPEDPMHNRNKFYCMICQVNVSIRAPGIYESKHHSQSHNLWRQDQFHREVLAGCHGREGRKSFIWWSVDSRKWALYELWNPGNGLKMVFLMWFIGGNPFLFPSIEDRVRMQLQLLTTFLRSGGRLWVLEEFRTQVGIFSSDAWI